MTQSRIFSNDILIALAKRGPMNCRQIAGQISHNLDKVVALVAYMRTNGKLQTADTKVDGMTAYALTSTGRDLVARLIEEERTDTREPASRPAASSESSKPSTAFDVKPQGDQKQTAKASAPVAANDEPKPQKTQPASRSSAPARVRLGVLNTGELMIWPEGHPPALLEPADVTALRAFLVATA